jgi:UDP-N-acetylglucosamine--N-acetylmuramyl-(pentapeptide) pyrophosphoryl-undecaprenol N-acetylglucosamine transferase
MSGISGHTGKRAPRVLLSGGGTGGHVYPAIAIADAIRRKAPDAVLAFAGSRERIEWKAVPRAGYAIHAISSQGLDRRVSARNLKLPLTLGRGLWQSRQLIEAFDADVAVGTGGYVAGPVIWAAHQRRRPVLIQEQNAHVGVTNRILSRIADSIHAAFPETLSVFPASRTTVSGNPTRADLTSVDEKTARREFGLAPGQRVLLVLGGSGGSRPLNRVIEGSLSDYLEDPDCVVVWQTGERFFEEISERVAPDPRLKLLPFIDRMDHAYSAASLAVCRSGANTCSELLATGTPAILIPSPHVAADHQTGNARGLVAMGAAILLPEREAADSLVNEWKSLWTDPERLESMSLAALDNATPDAADVIAADVLKLAADRIR